MTPHPHPHPVRAAMSRRAVRRIAAVLAGVLVVGGAPLVARALSDDSAPEIEDTTGIAEITGSICCTVSNGGRRPDQCGPVGAWHRM